MNRHKILIIWPPKLEYIFSIQKHYTFFGETIDYIRTHTDFEIKVMDGSALEYFQWDFIKEYANQYDFILVYTDTHNSISSINAVAQCKSISPKTIAISYGQGTAYFPQELINSGFDAVIIDPQFEESIVAYLQYKTGKAEESSLKGIFYKQGSHTIEIKETFEHNIENISFPALDLLPVQQYKNISGRNQLCFTVSRGCPYHCKFCRIPVSNSNKSSYRDINSTIEYIKKEKDNFGSIKFISPTFTERREWVVELCNRILNDNIKFKWIVTTRIELLDEELLKLMSDAGCIAIAFGLETLYLQTQKNVNKHYTKEFLIKQFDLIHKYKIIPKAFIMLGIKDQTKIEIEEMYNFLKANRVEIRPKEYYPYEDFFLEKDKFKLMQHFERTDTYCNNIIDDVEKREFINYLINRTNVR